MSIAPNATNPSDEPNQSSIVSHYSTGKHPPVKAWIFRAMTGWGGSGRGENGTARDGEGECNGAQLGEVLITPLMSR